MSKTNAGGRAEMSEVCARVRSRACDSEAQSGLVSAHCSASDAALLQCLKACMHRVGPAVT